MPAPTMGAICAESSGDLKPGPRREETLPPRHLRRIGSPPVIIAQEVQEAVYRQQGDLRARGVPNGAGLYAGAIHGDHYVAEVRPSRAIQRSEEHTSELQSRSDLVCRLLLEKKKSRHDTTIHSIVLPRITVDTLNRHHGV